MSEYKNDLSTINCYIHYNKFNLSWTAYAFSDLDDYRGVYVNFLTWDAFWDIGIHTMERRFRDQYGILGFHKRVKYHLEINELCMENFVFPYPEGVGIVNSANKVIISE